MSLRIARIVLLSCLPFLVGCPGPYEPGYNAEKPPDQNSLGFAYVGATTAVNAEWGVFWGIDRSPALTAPTRIRFQGVGTLIDTETQQPLDLSKEYLGAGGTYRPPADIPPEGAVVKVGCEVLSPFSNRWEKSPDYEIRVTKKNTPMDFRYGIQVTGDANAAQVKAGQLQVFGVGLRPRPLDPQVQWALVPPPGFTGDIGSVRARPWWGSDTWAFDYTAPTTVAAPMDVIFRTTAFDPWANQTRTVDFTLHLVP